MTKKGYRYTDAQRLEALCYYQDHGFNRTVDEMKIPRVTLSRWIKNWETIDDSVAQIEAMEVEIVNTDPDIRKQLQESMISRAYGVKNKALVAFDKMLDKLIENPDPQFITKVAAAVKMLDEVTEKQQGDSPLIGSGSMTFTRMMEKVQIEMRGNGGKAIPLKSTE